MRHATTVTAAPDPSFTALEVAARLNVSRSTVYNLVASGRLRAHRHGEGQVRPRGLRIPESAVEEYLSNSQSTKEVA